MSFQYTYTTEDGTIKSTFRHKDLEVVVIKAINSLAQIRLGDSYKVDLWESLGTDKERHIVQLWPISKE